uniref:Uncharacterized protein n=1 Tax=Timema tahoe TaxID=61484 RepID=A0A7R9ITD1_9NEOP|nr:unnamed protein product [Timema tahoe]
MGWERGCDIIQGHDLFLSCQAAKLVPGCDRAMTSLGKPIAGGREGEANSQSASGSNVKLIYLGQNTTPILVFEVKFRLYVVYWFCRKELAIQKRHAMATGSGPPRNSVVGEEFIAQVMSIVPGLDEEVDCRDSDFFHQQRANLSRVSTATALPLPILFYHSSCFFPRSCHHLYSCLFCHFSPNSNSDLSPFPPSSFFANSRASSLWVILPTAPVVPNS